MNPRQSVLATLALTGLTASITLADVGYDNTTTNTGTRSFTQLQIGDEVTLGPGSDVITNLMIGVTMQGQPGTADLQARLYANDGIDDKPGTLLWESDLLDDVALTGGDDLIDFDVPNVLVPDTFTWTIQISDTNPIAAGLPHYHPPTVGSSPDWAWFGNGTSWTILTNGQNPVNFMARIITESNSGPILGATAQCPGGGGIIVEWARATPNGPAALLYARSLGSFEVPNNRPCAGTTLGLSSQGLRVAWNGNSGPSGERILTSTISAAACGAHLQLLDLTTCLTSNTVPIGR